MFPGGANGWTNPYRYDGRDSARYDASDGLYWLSVRAYDPTLGRFLSRDPLGRAPLFFADNPYVYAGNNPLSNVDPSGQRYASQSSSTNARGASYSTLAGPQKGKPKKGAPKPPPTCIGIPGIKDCTLFLEGLIGVVAPTAILGAAIWGLFSSGGSLGWALQLAQTAVSTAGFALLTALHTGMAAILESLVYVNPWVRFVLDLFQVAVDIAAIVVSTITTYQAIMARGRATASFFQKLSLIIEKIQEKATSGVFGLAQTALGFWIGNTVAGAVFLMMDATAAIRDLQIALKSK